MTILDNSNFVVGVAFVAFLLVLWRFNVPAMLTKALDARAERIQEELDEARRIREEAQTLLASYEKKRKEMQDQAETIEEAAKREAAAAAVEA